MKVAFSVISIFLFCISVFAEINPVFQHYTTEDGLFHNEIRLIRKARNGMLWLGTQNGLSSFDGYRFSVYKHNDADSNSICSDKIYALETSATGNIWVGTTAGLCVLNPQTGKASSFRDTFKIQTNFEHDYISKLLEDRSGYLWITSNSGNFRYSIFNKTLDKILDGVAIDSYYESREGTFWVCHGREVSKYSRISNRIIQTYPVDINKLYTDRFGVLWGVGPQGLYRFMPGTGEFQWLSNIAHPLKNNISCIAEDRDGNLFLGDYGGGISIYSPKNNQVSYLLADPNVESSISSNDVYDIFADEAGVVWIGTQEGLDIFDWSRQRFIKWKYNPALETGLSNSFIQALYRDRNGKLWLGTRDQGLEKWINEANYINPQFEHYPPATDNTGISGEYVAGMCHDSKGRFWVASWGGGLSVKEKDSEEWTHFLHKPENPNSIPGNSVISVIEDRRGRILVGTLSGLSVITTDEKGNYCFSNYLTEKGNKKAISGNAVFTVFEDSKGRIWAGINNAGLNLMHEEIDGSVWFEHFMHNPDDSASISNDEVFVVFEDSKNRLWLGTSFAGFNRVTETVDREGKSTFTFKAYTEKNGLGDNEVNAILEDDFGYVWISTNKGLSRFNPEDESFVNYSEYDGVLKGKFRKNAAWKDKNGTLYFGGTAGVNIFNPTHFPKNTLSPKPVVSGFFIDNKKYHQGDLLEDKPVISLNENDEWLILLPENKNRFEMQLSAMSFTSPKRNKYKWRLDGFDNNWNFYEGSNPELSYSGLSPGNYKLKIKASNNDGVWNATSLCVDVKVERDGNFTHTVFLLLLGAVVASIILFVRKKRMSKNQSLQHSVISQEDQELVTKLNGIMQTEQPYLDFKLGLNDLAERMNISGNQLSALLNDVIGKSFYDYVNEFRIEEVKKRLIDPSHKKKTILSIAWDCGFNSKSAFNRIFKISTGLTPSSYQKKYSKR